MPEKIYNVIETQNGVPIKAWTKGVLLDDRAKEQLINVAKMPLVGSAIPCAIPSTRPSSYPTIESSPASAVMHGP